jgi:flagellum-specific peptidoglycan hydrolase FlgJ
MKIIIPVLMLPLSLAADTKTEKYIKFAAPLCIAAAKNDKIIASAMIAISIEESGWGSSPKAKTLNNHFGIKDRKTKKYKYFKSASQSFAGYVEFLNHSRYSKAKKAKTPYSFITELVKAGYCTEPGYRNRLMAIIKRYKLTVYDKNNTQFP